MELLEVYIYMSIILSHKRISPFSQLVMTSNFQQVSLYLINFLVEEQVEE